MALLTPHDKALIDAAISTIEACFSAEEHRLATAIRTTDGEIFTGVNVSSTIGTIDVCAEPIALGALRKTGRRDIATIVTVRKPRPTDIDQKLRIVSPCGKCRELLYDYCPDAFVLIADQFEVRRVRVYELLPFRYSKNQLSCDLDF